jgi:glycosyltransferase involved in cell wall biosynthesis
MLSVIIPTLDSERALVPTLAPLVSGATSGLVSEVLIADGGSRDQTVAVAEVAGCNFVTVIGPLGRRLKAAAAAARAPWVLFLRPAIVLGNSWSEEVRDFVDRSPPGERAAVFRRNAAAPSALHALASVLTAALGARSRPAPPLLISKQFYAALDGHSESVADPEADLIRRIGRRRIAPLSSSVFVARQILD